jgi:hypothetical protein
MPKRRGTRTKFTDYPHLRACDPVLHDSLRSIVQSGRRSVDAVERAGILPANTVFFSQPCPSRDGWNRAAGRTAWNARALETLAGADLVFMDPDNGLTRQPASLIAGNWAKYVAPEEVTPYLRGGKSLVIYHHQTREKGGLAVTIPEKFALLRSLGCETPWAFVFRRVSVRIYFVVPSPAHVETLLRKSTQFLDTPWARDRHFEIQLPSS